MIKGDHWDPNVVRSFMHQLCDELDIDAPKLELVSVSDMFSRQLLMILGIQSTCYCPFRNTIYLIAEQIHFMNASPLVVLAHELKHHEQTIQGRLAAASGLDRRPYAIWEGQAIFVDHSSIESHANLPWEAEAIRYEKEIADRLGVSSIERLNNAA